MGAYLTAIRDGRGLHLYIMNLKNTIMRKRITQTLLSALLLMIPVCLSAEEAASRIVVHNGIEFIKALGPNRTVVIAAGSHINLTDEVMNGHIPELGIKHVDLIVDSKKAAKTGLVQYAQESDGMELHIAYMKNLTIEGEGATRPHIQVRPRYTYVLTFDHCENITLRNIEVGHTDEGYCTGGVLSFNDCKGIEVDNCDLYGCGTEGIGAFNCENLQCSKSIIRDCSYYIMTLQNVKGKINFSECQFLRNKEYNLVNADVNCSKLNFIQCEFRDNHGMLFSVKCPTLLDRCTVVHDGEMGDLSLVENHESQLTTSEDDFDGDPDVEDVDTWGSRVDESEFPLQYYLWQGDYAKQQLRLALCRRGKVLIGEALIGEGYAYPITVRGLMDKNDQVTLYLLNGEDPTVVDIQLEGKLDNGEFTGMDVTTLKAVKLKKMKGKTPYAIDRSDNFASPWHKDNYQSFDGRDGDSAGNYTYVGPLNKQGTLEIWRGINGDMQHFRVGIVCKTGAYQYENDKEAMLDNHQLFLSFHTSDYSKTYVLRIRFYEGFVTVTCVEGSPDGIVPSNITLEGIYFEVPSVG